VEGKETEGRTDVASEKKSASWLTIVREDPVRREKGQEKGRGGKMGALDYKSPA